MVFIPLAKTNKFSPMKAKGTIYLLIYQIYKPESWPPANRLPFLLRRTIQYLSF